jgi:hypothetical protein
MYGNDMESDFFFRAWQIINDISDQLAHNQKFSSSLLSQIESLKVRSPYSTQPSFYRRVPPRSG